MFSPVSSIVLDYTQVLQIHYTITLGYLSPVEYQQRLTSEFV